MSIKVVYYDDNIEYNYKTFDNIPLDKYNNIKELDCDKNNFRELPKLCVLHKDFA